MKYKEIRKHTTVGFWGFGVLGFWGVKVVECVNYGIEVLAKTEGPIKSKSWEFDFYILGTFRELLFIY